MIETNNIVSVEAVDNLSKVRDRMPNWVYGNIPNWDYNFGQDGYLWLVVDSENNNINNIIYIKTSWHVIKCECISPDVYPNVFKVLSGGEGHTGLHNNQDVSDLDCKLTIRKVGMKGW